MNVEAEKFTHSEMRCLSEVWQGAGLCSMGSSQQALQRHFSACMELLDGCGAVWIAAVHGMPPSDVFSSRVFNNWWAVDTASSDPGYESEVAIKTYLDLAREHGSGMDTKHVVCAAGKSRVHIRKDFASDEEWESYWKHQRYHVPILGISDRLYAVCNLGERAESYLLIDRPLGAEPFGERERALAELALNGSVRLHRMLLMERGWLGVTRQPLSPRERDVFPLLFKDLTEKEIADELDISKSTLHQHVIRIYQKFQVNSRIGLLAACAS